VDEQKFRSDLFYRLNVFPVRVPSLRERPEDIPLLVRHFAEVYSRRLGKAVETIPSESMNALMLYDWPGNVRELQNIIERAVIVSNGSVLQVAASELRGRPSARVNSRASGPTEDNLARPAVQVVDRDGIVRALKEARGRVGGPDGAAARLGLKRTTLIARMKKLGITPRSVT
jgi:formate hydrogenlyase transcriptional activator